MMGMAAGGGAEAATGLTLVKDGQPAAVVIMPDRASAVVLAAAKQLDDVVFQMSGARLRTVREGELSGARVEGNGLVVPGSNAPSAFVLLGEGKLAQQLGATSEGLGPGGIRIKTLGNTLALLGPDEKTPSDPLGTVYAVNTFLDQ